MTTTPSPTQSPAAPDPSARLLEELNGSLRRLRQLGGAVAVEEFSGAIGDNSPFADEVDHIQATESRDIDLATRGLLVERVNRLCAALRRLHHGEYGVCIECGVAVSTARLHAMPEAQTCVRCQDGIERRRRQIAPGRSAFAAGEDGGMRAMSHASVPSSFLHLEERRDASSLRLLSEGR